LSGSQFLSSIEQFDKSSASWNVPLQRDWRIINHALNSPRYEMALAAIPATRITVKSKTYLKVFQMSNIKNKSPKIRYLKNWMTLKFCPTT